MIKEKDFPDGGRKQEGDGAMRKEIRYQMILWAMAAAVSGCGNARGASIAAEEKRTVAESGQSLEASGSQETKLDPEEETASAGETIQAESETGPLPGVTMEITDVTETGITVSLVNHTELNMEFGEEYSLEVWNGTDWEPVPYRDGQWAFHSIAYSMPENQPVEWKADWEALYGTLEPGRYRLVKPVMDFRGPGTLQSTG